MCKRAFRDSAGGHMQSISKEVFLERDFFFFQEKAKKGRFRVRVDECIDGGILIGVILT